MLAMIATSCAHHQRARLVPPGDTHPEVLDALGALHASRGVQFSDCMRSASMVALSASTSACVRHGTN
jgi:hypothetical protein